MILNRATRTAHEEEVDALLAELVDRFINRFHAGEPVEVRAFAAEHPEHAEALLELLPAAATIARLRRSSLGSEPPSAHFRLNSDSIGGYRIVREVGRGGMGVVYEAVQVAVGRKVALKVLPISAVTDPRQIERFRIEGQAAAALDHPHIVPVFEIGCEQGVHFYAMRFVEGCSLAAVVREARSIDSPTIMTPREAARLALQAAEALAHAHELGILHRDIKPANLLVDAAGHLWVADFGLAHFPDGGDLTQTGDVIGTLRYLSPEQARGRRKLDAPDGRLQPRGDPLRAGDPPPRLRWPRPPRVAPPDRLRRANSPQAARPDHSPRPRNDSLLGDGQGGRRSLWLRHGARRRPSTLPRRPAHPRPPPRRPNQGGSMGTPPQGHRVDRDDRPLTLPSRHGRRRRPALARTDPDAGEPPGGLDRTRRVLPLHSTIGPELTRDPERRTAAPEPSAQGPDHLRADAPPEPRRP